MPKIYSSQFSGKDIITKVNILNRIKDTSEAAGNEVRVSKLQRNFGNSLVGQWLRLHEVIVKDPGSEN